MAILLTYGVNAHGALVPIDHAPRGKTHLKCPYCGQPLIARKGKIKAHHFAHAGETCLAVAGQDIEAVTLPYYDTFNIGLSPKLLKALHEFHGSQWLSKPTADKLERAGVIEYNRFVGVSGDYQLTPLGKIPFGETPLAAFIDLQQQQTTARHRELVSALEHAYNGRNAFGGKINVDSETLEAHRVDLRLFRAQWQRVLSAALYFVQIDHTGGVLYKVGVTTRDLHERTAEIERDLHPHLGKVTITPLHVLHHFGQVERYFKHRYRAHLHPIGQHTEYFAFNDRRAVLADLTRMGNTAGEATTPPARGCKAHTKHLTEVERAVLAGDRPGIVERIDHQHFVQRVSEGTKRGMQRAKARGVQVGRPPGTTEDDNATLAKYPAVVDALRGGLSLRKAAAAAGVSVNTVRKVKSILESEANE